MADKGRVARRTFLRALGTGALGMATAACGRKQPVPATPTEPPVTPEPQETSTSVPSPSPTRQPARRRLGAAQSRFPTAGEWPCHRGNGTQDAWSPLKGQMTQPGVVWKHFAGSVETLLAIRPGSGEAAAQVPLPVLKPATAVSDPRWGLVPQMVELAGKQQPLVRNITTTYAHVLADEPGLQKLEFESSFDKPAVGGTWALCVGRCFAWRSGAWAQVWETETLPMLFHPLPLVGDFDADGSPEVAILPWYELLVFDARTGKIKDRCRFTEGRSYGFFGVYDLDGDGKSEFVVEADFAKHVNVMGYREGKLKQLWHREIELGFGDPQKVLRAGPDPVADVDGDGRLEVLVNLYNGNNDKRWHITVHDCTTGEIKADLLDEFLNCPADVDGDGIAELLTTPTNGAGVPLYGPIAVRSLRTGKVETLWQTKDAGWQTWDPPQPMYVNSSATLANRTVLLRNVGAQSTVVLRAPAPDDQNEAILTVAAWGPTGFEPRITVRGRLLEGAGIDEVGNVLVRTVTQPGQKEQVRVLGGTAEPLASQARGVEPGPATVVAPREAPAPVVVVQGSGEELVAFSGPLAGNNTTSGEDVSTDLWRRPGRGQSVQWPQPAGPVLADIEGDGLRQYVYATASPTGSGRLAVADLEGKELWHHDFPAIPGTVPIWNTGGVILWQVGYFTDPKRQDVLVNVRRSIMHSDETYLLSGRDGRELWHRDHQPYDRGVGGQPFAIADYDGDGLEDAASLYPDILYLLKGTTGEDLITVKQGPYWGAPVAGDWESTGKPTVFFATERASLTALYRLNGSLAWLDAQDKSPSSLAAFGDFDGDSQLEAIGVGYPNGIRCYDTATGRVKWRLASPLPGNPVGGASGDLNGDGRDEAIFVTGKTLWCTGAAATGDEGIVLWRVELPPDRLGPPAIADVDGSGKPSILVVGNDGYVYCLR